MPTAKKAAKKTVKKAPEATEPEVINNEAEETAPEAPKGATVARVYNRNKQLMRTFTREEHGAGFVAEAEALAAQPRRNGWEVSVQ